LSAACRQIADRIGSAVRRSHDRAGPVHDAAADIDHADEYAVRYDIADDDARNAVPDADADLGYVGFPDSDSERDRYVARGQRNPAGWHADSLVGTDKPADTADTADAAARHAAHGTDDRLNVNANGPERSNGNGEPVGSPAS
jgi:hypothetical protein